MRPLITYRQLCAVTNDVIAAQPRQSDSEWVEAIKCRLVRLGFSYPQPHELTAAIRGVEYARRKTPMFRRPGVDRV